MLFVQGYVAHQYVLPLDAEDLDGHMDGTCVSGLLMMAVSANSSNMTTIGLKPLLRLDTGEVWLPKQVGNGRGREIRVT